MTLLSKATWRTQGVAWFVDRIGRPILCDTAGWWLSTCYGFLAKASRAEARARLGMAGYLSTETRGREGDA